MKIIGEDAFPNAQEHNHAPEARDVCRAVFLDTIKKTAKESRNQARQLIADACGTITSEVSAYLPTTTQMARTVNRVRNKENIAKGDEIKLDGEFTTTAKGDIFLFFDNEIESNRIIMFATSN